MCSRSSRNAESEVAVPRGGLGTGHSPQDTQAHTQNGQSSRQEQVVELIGQQNARGEQDKGRAMSGWGRDDPDKGSWRTRALWVNKGEGDVDGD